MARLDRKAFLAKADVRKSVMIDVPGVDGQIELKEMSVKQASIFRKKQQEIQKADDDGAYLGLFVDIFLMCAINEDGSPLFKEDDRPVLEDSLTPASVVKLTEQILDMLNPKQEQIEELEKNSESDQTSDSSSS